MLKALVIFFTALTVWVSPAFASTPIKGPQGMDCKQKKNQKRIECKEAPKSNVKAAVKKPEKVRKAPASVQKKAAAENAKK